MNSNLKFSYTFNSFCFNIFVLFSTNIYAQTSSNILTQKYMETSSTFYSQNYVLYKTVEVQGINIFYREAGNPARPTIVLLHGFPSSSHMYRDLITLLSDKYHLIAPDYPGFGYSSAPSPQTFSYSFDHIAEVMEAFLDTLGIKRFSIYMQDYGGPVGFRIIAKRPKAIQTLIIQNANMYYEGLGDDVQKTITLMHSENDRALNEVIDHMISFNGIKEQYLYGAAHPENINPDSYHMDHYFIEQPGRKEIQHALFKNYKTNFPKYPQWQTLLRKYQFPLLVVWGKNDKIFPGAGGLAYKKDVPDAEIHLLDGGHFLLEEYNREIANLINNFLQKKLKYNSRP